MSITQSLPPHSWKFCILSLLILLLAIATSFMFFIGCSYVIPPQLLPQPSSPLPQLYPVPSYLLPVHIPWTHPLVGASCHLLSVPSLPLTEVVSLFSCPTCLPAFPPSLFLSGPSSLPSINPVGLLYGVHSRHSWWGERLQHSGLGI